MIKKKGVFTKSLALSMALAMTVTNLPADLIGSVTDSDVAELSNVSAASTNYGLADNIQDGTILHCFDWKYNDIKAMLPEIAASGFTSIQTSPAQAAYVGDNPNVWYWLYQPLNFAISTNNLGTKAELEALCTEADKYGIKVVVDVVANHLAGDHTNIDNDLKDSQYWHNSGYSSQQIDWNIRWQVTHGDIGMPDINSEHSYVQQKVANYVKELKSVGVDGIRWDAAKHISLPSEGCNFWSAVTQEGLYNYGEILKGPANNIDNQDTINLMKEYTNYISVTDDEYCSTVLGAFRDGNATSAYGMWTNKGVSSDKLVYWAESHDTYSNETYEGGWTKYISQNVIDRAYAVVASRANASALYFSRPYATEKSQIQQGVKGSTHFTSKEVAEVNKFHNAMIGQKEYYTTGSNCAVVCREKGAVIAAGSGSNMTVTVPNGGGLTEPGTYTDQVSGNTWTVTSSTISGKIGDTGIAVLYEPNISKDPEATISKEGGNFSTDTLELTLGLKNATSGTYQIGNGSVKTFTSSTKVTIGSDMSYGDSVTVKLTATNGTDTYSDSFTFTKVEQTGNIAYFSLPSGWGDTVYCYAYDSATETVSNGEWPGQKMTKDSETGYYVYEIPENIEKPRVIFYNSDSNRTPADMEKGYLFDEECAYLYKNGSWSQYTAPVTNGTVIVKYVDENGNEIASAEKLTDKVGAAYSTSAATIDGYTLSKTPSNAKGTYTKESITVTYVYTEVVDNTPKVTTSLADGSTFKSETQTITLTLKNAEKGTYSVDNGPVKSFTGSAKVVLGQGKVADSTVTVKATATSGSTTKTYTFTYNKEFNGTVDETANTINTYAVKAAASAGSNLAKQYSTNANGVGVKKTISVDGDLSDWNSSMLIAQGAANDDPRVYRTGSMHELPIDLYALYGAYDDNNLYLMWEMTNVQDVVAPNDNYPLSQGILWQTQELPFFIAIDTGKSSDAIGNNGALQTGGTIWDSGMTISNKFNRLISINTKGQNGPYVYSGDSTGLNAVEVLGPTGANKSKIKMNYGKGILSNEVVGIDGAYGEYNGRVVGDVSNDSAAWVNFNTKGHNSSSMDFFYEMSIPLDELGITKSDVEKNGVGVLLVATFGKSGMDCLPYDTAMNDNADQEDTQSQPINSFEKSDEDNITTSFARIGKNGGTIIIPDDLELNFGADRSAPQEAGTGLTLKGIAEGGTAPYTYKYYVDGTLVDTKSGNGETSTSWTPVAGDHLIKCVVTDSNNNTVTSAKYFTVEGEACNHSNTTVKNAKAATCTTTGYTGDTYCADCGTLVATGKTTDVLGHSWNGGVITKQPTATETGIRTYTCTTCGATKEEVIQKVDCTHTSTVVKNAKAATCTEAGYTGDTYCASCNLLLASGTATTALGHSWDGGVVTKAPTSTETGIRTFTCNNCGTTKTEVIPVVTCNHSYVIENQVAVTCTQNGYTGDVHCGACGELLIQGQVIPAIDHVWDDGVVTIEATATTDGVLTYHCVNCSETVEEPIPATGEDEGGDDDEISDELEVGDTVVVNKATYRITKLTDTNKTVEFVVSNSKATTVTVPKTITVDDTTFKVTAIANGAFKGSKTLKKVTIGSNVTKIGNNAFKNCKKLTTVSMGSNVTTIGASAFYNCTKLTSITIPANVKKIGKTAFYGCKKLATITINSTKLTAKNVGAKAFKNIKAKATIKVPESKLTSYTTILQNKGVSAKATIAAK